MHPHTSDTSLRRQRMKLQTEVAEAEVTSVRDDRKHIEEGQ